MCGSNVSIWLAPPHRNRKMTDLSFRTGFAPAAGPFIALALAAKS
jgi:hypothetical protein